MTWLPLLLLVSGCAGPMLRPAAIAVFPEAKGRMPLENVSRYVLQLGDEIEVPTLTGKTRLEIAGGTPAGKVLKIKGEGVPAFGMEGRRGEDYIKVDIEVPTKLSKPERELLEKLAVERKEKIQMKKGFF